MTDFALILPVAVIGWACDFPQSPIWRGLPGSAPPRHRVHDASLRAGKYPYSLSS